jgi:hypothetical protein
VHYIDETGSRVASLVPGGDFSEGVATRRFGDQVGYVNRTGAVVIPARFDGAATFSEGLALVKVRDRYGFIDHSGNLVIPARFAYAARFTDGHSFVIENGPCERIGYGPCEYPSNPPYAVPDNAKLQPEAMRSRCRYSVIDKTGKIVSATPFIDAKPFSEGLAPMGDGKHWGYVDHSGQVRIGLQFEDAEPFFEGLARIRQGGEFCDGSGTRSTRRGSQVCEVVLHRP